MSNSKPLTAVGITRVLKKLAKDTIDIPVQFMCREPHRAFKCVSLETGQKAVIFVGPPNKSQYQVVLQDHVS